MKVVIAKEKPWLRLRRFWIALVVVGALVVQLSAIVVWHLGKTPPRPVQHVWIVAQSGPGRLGNQMFQYASSLGISHDRQLTHNKDGIHFCVDPNHEFQALAHTFVGPFPFCPQLVSSNIIHLDEKGYGIHQTFPTDCPNNNGPCVYSMGPYLQSFRYFSMAAERVRSSFRPLPSLELEATQFVTTIRKQATSSTMATILVGIHVRRGDALQVPYLQIPHETYFANAMDYYRSKYNSDKQQVLFVVASDDVLWCREQSVFGQDDVVITPSHDDPRLDLSILLQCNHMIMSLGTFGWWAGWLAGGEVVYYKDGLVLDHPTSQGQVNLNDYYPPHWIAMS